MKILSSKRKVNNFLTIDVEEWYHANYKSVNFSSYTNKATNLEKAVDQILELFENYHVKATFFVLGEVALSKPSIVKKIAETGHEVASHSHSHRLVYSMKQKEFEDDLQRSCAALENIAGKKVVGYRAPSWSVHKKDLPWFYKILLDNGIKYSSSVFPTKNFLYGIPDANPLPHRVTIHEAKDSLWEVPASTFQFFSRNFGYSGGFYMRLLPEYIIKRLIQSSNKCGHSSMIYLHPREVDPVQEKLILPLREKIIHYFGIHSCKKKLEAIVRCFASSFDETLADRYAAI